jgi:hypothetical protein
MYINTNTAKFTPGFSIVKGSRVMLHVHTKTGIDFHIGMIDKAAIVYKA